MNCRASRKKLEEIAYNCQRAAMKRINNFEQLAKADKFYRLREEKLQREKELAAQGKKFEDCNIGELEALWQKAKGK